MERQRLHTLRLLPARRADARQHHPKDDPGPGANPRRAGPVLDDRRRHRVRAWGVHPREGPFGRRGREGDRAGRQKEMLECARGRCASVGLSTRVTWHRNFPDSLGVEGPVDFVLSFHVVHEVPGAARKYRSSSTVSGPVGGTSWRSPILMSPGQHSDGPSTKRCGPGSRSRRGRVCG